MIGTLKRWKKMETHLLLKSMWKVGKFTISIYSSMVTWLLIKHRRRLTMERRIGYLFHWVRRIHWKQNPYLRNHYNLEWQNYRSFSKKLTCWAAWVTSTKVLWNRKEVATTNYWSQSTKIFLIILSLIHLNQTFIIKL